MPNPNLSFIQFPNFKAKRLYLMLTGTTRIQPMFDYGFAPIGGLIRPSLLNVLYPDQPQTYPPGSVGLVGGTFNGGAIQGSTIGWPGDYLATYPLDTQIVDQTVRPDLVALMVARINYGMITGTLVDL